MDELGEHIVDEFATAVISESLPRCVDIIEKRLRYSNVDEKSLLYRLLSLKELEAEGKVNSKDVGRSLVWQIASD
jgi:hypothetical protein